MIFFPGLPDLISMGVEKFTLDKLPALTLVPKNTLLDVPPGFESTTFFGALLFQWQFAGSGSDVSRRSPAQTAKAGQGPESPSQPWPFVQG